MTDVKQKQEKLIHDIACEICKNYDAEDPQYISLMEQLGRLLDKKNNCDIQALEQIHFRLTQVNNANDELLEEYKNDKKFVRIHKRICERNRHLLLDFKTPIIAECDHDVIPVLLKVKTFFDGKMNAGYQFNFTPYSDVSKIIGREEDTDSEMIANLVKQEYRKHLSCIRGKFAGLRSRDSLVEIIGWNKITEMVSIL